MKIFYLFILWIAAFAFFFFLLSFFGLLWVATYHAVISDFNWFMVYFMFIGWWAPSMIVIHESERIYKT